MPAADLHPELGRWGFGAAGIGNLYREVSDEVATATVQAAWDGGVRYFDTAPHYGLGLSERRLGAALADKPRDEYLVSTKVGRLVVPNPDPTEDDMASGFAVPGTLRRQWDPSEAGVRRSLDESRERLGLDRIDIAYLHDPDVYDLGQGIAEGLPALATLRAEGALGGIGVGANSAEALVACVRAAHEQGHGLDLVMLAGRYTLLEQPALAELLPLCMELGVGVVNVGVYNSGLLARAVVPEDAHYNYAQAPAELIARARTLAEVCQEFGVDLPTAALQYSLRYPAVRSVVVGAASPAQMEQNVERAQTAVPEELWVELIRRGLIPA
ncbi:aldo/keto reductase [Psychromicrobium xiongbiense]|uniref:aldo/keto reductase n=1 Tax=Psychromicrobium xiongbiense TaxID=3051184 RepID=UPI002557C2BE|nr:aldo/keto reductase [Psychromicrobium sp. YIM S02556]